MLLLIHAGIKVQPVVRLKPKSWWSSSGLRTSLNIKKKSSKSCHFSWKHVSCGGTGRKFEHCMHWLGALWQILSILWLMMQWLLNLSWEDSIGHVCLHSEHKGQMKSLSDTFCASLCTLWHILIYFNVKVFYIKWWNISKKVCFKKIVNVLTWWHIYRVCK